MSIKGSGSLNYLGVTSTQPPNLIIMDRRPTVRDGIDMPLGTLWLIPQADITNTIKPQREEWVLVGAQQNIFIWERVTGSGSQDLAIHQVVLGTGGPTLTTVPNGTVGQILTSQGPTVDPIWTTPRSPSMAVNTIVYSTPGSFTYTPTVGMVNVTVEAVGGGMSIGLVPSLSLELGGSSGGYCKKTFTAAQIGTSQSFVVGAGGTVAIAPNYYANSGGDTTFGSFLTAGGGVSGGASAYGSHGGIATGGDLNINGQTIPLTQATGVVNTRFAPDGGSTIYGFGGKGGIMPNGSIAQPYDVNPFVASGYGSGASALLIYFGGSLSDGVGAGGIVIITEYL